MLQSTQTNSSISNHHNSSTNQNHYQSSTLGISPNNSSENMHISSIINDGFGLLSKQLRFYCWHYKRNLPRKHRQELIELLQQQHFEPLANKIRFLNQSSIEDCRQQIGKLLFHNCLSQNRRNQLIKLIKSDLVDINVRLDNYGNTLLHRSAYTLDVALVKLLIEVGADIRLRDSSGNTALHIAIQSYRNGAVLYGNQADVVQNLTSILRLLLDSDESLQNNRYLERKWLPSNGIKTATNSLDQSKRRTISEPLNIDELLGNPINQVNVISYSKSKIPKINLKLQPMTSPKLGKYQKSVLDKVSCKNNMTFRQDRQAEFESQTNTHANVQSSLDPILLEDLSSNLIDTKNGFGHTALHLCVMVVGEQFLDQFVKLLLAYGPDPNVTDNRMQTPLYCLVKRPGVSAIKQKCAAIVHLLKAGCDDLGLAITPNYFSATLVDQLEQNISSLMQASISRSSSSMDPIFSNVTTKRVSSLKHLSRLRLIKFEDEVSWKSKSQKHRYLLPSSAPASLNQFMNRKILHQSELF